MTALPVETSDWMPDAPWTNPAATLVLPSTAPRAQWLEHRQSGLGASDVAAVFGVSRFATAWDVWAEKTGRVVPGPENEAMLRGRILEDAILALWQQTREEPVLFRRCGLVRSKAHPWMLATVDRLSVCPRGTCITEVKSAIDMREWAEDEAPVEFQLQTAQQIAATGRDHAHLVVLGPRFQITERTFTRDDELNERMVSHLGPWWQRHVLADVEPDATAKAADGLSRLYGDPDPDVVCELPKPLWPLDTEIRMLDKQIAELAEQRENKIVTLKQAAGPASQIRAGGALIATWSPTRKIAGATAAWRKANAALIGPYLHDVTEPVFDVDAFVADHPDLLGNGQQLYRVRQFRFTD